MSIGLAAAIAAGAAVAAPPLPTADAAAPFVNWARDHVRALPDCDDMPDTAEPETIAALIGSAHVVALGEPVHGARQPLALRNCLFGLLVERHGFTAIALETGLTESRRLEEYVAGGPGDARHIARDNFSWGFGHFTANVALIEWMRRYNADPVHPRKLHIYGVDLSGGDASGAWRDARITLDASLGFLIARAPWRSQAIRSRLAPFLEHFSQTGFAGLPPRDRDRLAAALKALIEEFDRNRTALIKAGGTTDFEWARQNAVVARQLERTFRVSSPPHEELRADDDRADAARDSAMAANALWVRAREGKAGRMMLFAHDGHVFNSVTRGGPWSVYRRAPRAMGFHLRAALRDDLRIVATVAGTGGASLDQAFARIGPMRFLLALRPASGAAGAWLTRVQTIGVNRDSVQRIRPREAADAVAYIQQLTPAETTSSR